MATRRNQISIPGARISLGSTCTPERHASLVTETANKDVPHRAAILETKLDPLVDDSYYLYPTPIWRGTCCRSQMIRQLSAR